MEDNPDYPVTIRLGILRRVRNRLEGVKPRRPLHQFLLAVASVASGGFIGVLYAGLAVNSNLWWFFYIVLPSIATASGVAFWFIHHVASQSISDIVAESLNDLPDPDNPSVKFNPAQNLVGTWKMTSITERSRKEAIADIVVSDYHGRLVINGVMTGQNNKRIGEFVSLFCHYNPEDKKLMAMYRVSGIDDNGKISTNECALSGIVFLNSKEEKIEGQWFQLYGDLSRGRVTITKQ